MPISDQADAENGNTRRQEFSEAQLRVLQAFERRWEETGRLPFETVVMTGQGPFRRGKLWSYLRGLGAVVGEMDDLPAPDLLVLGREGADEDAVARLLRRRQGKALRICSQEMLLAWAMTSVDPNEHPQTVKTFIDGHPALEMVRTELEGQWPGTDPIPNYGGGNYDPGQVESPLIRIGYRVGRTNGKPEGERRRLLRKAYRMELSSFPGDYSNEYIEKWGPAESGQRLKRMASHLAGRCRSFRRNEHADYSDAVSDYEDDLGWLKQTFYNPMTYGFRWPSS